MKTTHTVHYPHMHACVHSQFVFGVNSDSLISYCLSLLSSVQSEARTSSKLYTIYTGAGQQYWRCKEGKSLRTLQWTNLPGFRKVTTTLTTFQPNMGLRHGLSLTVVHSLPALVYSPMPSLYHFSRSFSIYPWKIDFSSPSCTAVYSRWAE